MLSSVEEVSLRYMGGFTGAALIRLINSRGKWFEIGRCARIFEGGRDRFEGGEGGGERLVASK